MPRRRALKENKNLTKSEREGTEATKIKLIIKANEAWTCFAAGYLSCMGIKECFFFFPNFYSKAFLPLIFFVCTFTYIHTLHNISEEEPSQPPSIHKCARTHAPPINSTGRTDEQIRMNEYTMDGVFGLILFIYRSSGLRLVKRLRGKQRLAIFSLEKGRRLIMGGLYWYDDQLAVQ